MPSTTLRLLTLIAATAACSSARPAPARPSADPTVAQEDDCIRPYYKLRRSPATAVAIAHALREINVAKDRLIQTLRVEEPGADPAVLYVVARCFRQDPNDIIRDASEVRVEDTQAAASGTTPPGFDAEAIAR